MCIELCRCVESMKRRGQELRHLRQLSTQATICSLVTWLFYNSTTMKRNFKGLGLTVSLMTFLLIFGCSKDSNDEPEPQPAPGTGGRTAEVVIQNMAFGPASLTVARGTTVTWTNNENMTHTVTADNNSFSSPNINYLGTYSRTFNDAGTFPYHCTPHPQMKGTIVVQ